MTVAVAVAILSALAGLVGWGRVFSQNRSDEANARKANADADAILVSTARELVAEVRSEMDRKVAALHQELGRLRGHLESTARERDHLREVETALRRENAQLRERVDSLEERVRVLTTAAELAEAEARTPGTA